MNSLPPLILFAASNGCAVNRFIDFIVKKWLSIDHGCSMSRLESLLILLMESSSDGLPKSKKNQNSKDIFFVYFWHKVRLCNSMCTVCIESMNSLFSLRATIDSMEALTLGELSWTIWIEFAIDLINFYFNFNLLKNIWKKSSKLFEII